MRNKTTAIIGLLAVTALIFGFQALGTTQVGLTEVKEEGGQDGDSLTGAFQYLTKGNFEQKGTTNIFTLPDTDGEGPANSVKFHFTTDGDGKTFSAACFIYDITNGPAQLVCTITATGGSQRVITWPDDGADPGADRFWVDTITVIDRWPKVVGAGSSGGGHNLISTLFFDPMGGKFIRWVVWDADGSTGTEAGNVSIWGSYF